MSKIICAAAIKGAYKIVERAENAFKEALLQYGPKKEVELPNTAYYLPVIYGITGHAVKKIEDMEKVLKLCRELLPPIPSETLHLPYLGWALDAGMATLFADEIIESLKYLQDPCPYLISPNPSDDKLWIGAADDKIMRERGIEFVDGTAPGFAACVGACPSVEIAQKIATELQEKNLYVFLSSHTNGVSMAEQLQEKGVQMGWDVRLVPFGKDTTATVFSLGFAVRAAMSFGGVAPGDYRRILLYNKHRIFAFVLALGYVDEEKYAQAAGAINFGFPTIADTDIPSIYPRGVCLYEHVVPSVPHERIVDEAIKVRGLKIIVSKVDIPTPYGPAFEGERIRKEDMHVEISEARTKKPSFEYLCTKPSEQVENGRVQLHGPDIDSVQEGGSLPLGIVVEVAGAKMQKDFEPILERQIHRFINYAQGFLHIGQRDSNWIRVSKAGYKTGLRLHHIGKILCAKLLQEYSAIVDKVQVTLYTEEEKVKELRALARKVYKERDERIAGLRDEDVDIFYSCTLCQSFAPDHVCIITPERSGLCGAYSWLDGRAAYQINPEGPNKPVNKGRCIDQTKGQWEGVNAFVKEASHGKVETFNAYSLMEYPMTSCGCFECITVVLPMANGVMIVHRDHMEMTPCGMKFSTLAGTIGGGQQNPGFVGHSKLYIGSKKYLLAEGGLARVVWMPHALKEEVRELIERRAEEIGLDGFFEKIADERTATTEEEVLQWAEKVQHPALQLPPIIQ